MKKGLPSVLTVSKQTQQNRLRKLMFVLNFRCLNKKDQIPLVFPHFRRTRTWERKGFDCYFADFYFNGIKSYKEVDITSKSNQRWLGFES